MKHSVASASNLFDFFHELVEEARTSNGSAISDDTGLYLASLLTERARADRPALPETTLAELHGRAANAPPAQQAHAYRELGDRALYAVGYFTESLSRRIVGPDYYAEMGAAAYHRVDLVFKRWFADAFGPVFRELALDFNAAVDVLQTVRDAHADEEPDTLVAVYQKWLRTGSPECARILRRNGLIVPGEDVDA